MQPAVIRNEKPAALKKLKPLPAVAIRLMQLVSTDEVVFRRVAELIRIDAAFSAEVLRVATPPCWAGANGSSESCTPSPSWAWSA